MCLVGVDELWISRVSGSVPFDFMAWGVGPGKFECWWEGAGWWLAGRAAAQVTGRSRVLAPGGTGSREGCDGGVRNGRGSQYAFLTCLIKTMYTMEFV